jgi:hypothetical protein
MGAGFCNFNRWEKAFAASVGTHKHHYPHPSFKNNVHYTLAKWDEKTKG